MSLTFNQLMTCNPFFFGNILAGWNGKANIISNVCFNEIPSQPDSVLIIESTEQQFPLIEASLENKLTNGIIVFSKTNRSVPYYLIDLANEIQKPLLFFVKEDEHYLLNQLNQVLSLEKQNLLHILSNEMVSYWLEILNMNDIHTVLKRLSKFIGQEVMFFNNKKQYGNLSSFHLSSNDINHLNEFQLIENDISIISDGSNEFFSYKIKDSFENTIGYLFLEKIRNRLDFDIIRLFQLVTPAIKTWIKQEESAQSIHLKYRDQLFFDILNNNIETENELHELIQIWKMDFTPNGFVLAINLQSNHAITKDIINNIQNQLETHDRLNIYSTYLSHRIVSIIFFKSKTISKEEFNQWLRQTQCKISELYPDIKTVIGIGRPYVSNLDLHKSFQEAKIALQMHDYVQGSDGLIHYQDIGYIRLLSYIHDDLLKDFSKQYLGKLMNHDRENETELIQTLYYYCNHNGDISKTAQALFIHQNTLRQRLKKIESILDVQLNSYTDLMNLMLSLKISQDMR